MIGGPGPQRKTGLGERDQPNETAIRLSYNQLATGFPADPPGDCSSRPG
jgi:hypothetical protein